MDGCYNSQFDILIRTICGLPVKDVKCSGKWEMKNIIGEEINNIANIINNQDYMLHLYSKQQTKPGRKMGHYNTKIT